ncbi:MAG: hypothetical protein MJZ20_14825, partial [Bacteroidaceae bacterium]|nr:hypothetical protein [Bacteroidaceae bacterium]
MAILASTNAWGSSACIPITEEQQICDVPYYGKVSAHVSSKYSGGGKVYVHSSAFVDEDNTYFGSVEMPNLDEAEAAAKSEGYENWPIYTLHPILEMGTSQPDTAWLFAFPAPGYYFKGWSQVDNDYDLGAANPLTPSVLSMAIPEPDMEGEQLLGVKWPTEDQIPSIGSFYATFRPVLVNECVEGDNLFMTTEDEETDFDVYFSTSFASHDKEDFAAPELTNAVTAGGVFAINGDCEFTEDNEVKVPLKFIPNQGIQEGVYSCQLTVASKGGSSITATIKMTVEEEPDDEAAIGDVNYSTFENALAAANTMDNAVITLSKNVDVETPQVVTANMTIDLNGKVLNGTAEQVLVIAGGKLTLVDSKKIGKIQHNLSTPGQTVVISAGSVVMNGGTISMNSEYEIQEEISTEQDFIMRHMVGAVLVYPGIVPKVSGPASFEMNDGVINANGMAMVGGVINVGGTTTINAGEIYSTGYMGVLAASNMGGSLNILGGNLKAELNADFGTATMGYGVL